MALPLRQYQTLVQDIVDEMDLDNGWNFAKKNIGFLLEADPALMALIRKRAATTLGEMHIWRALFRDNITPQVGDAHRTQINSFARIAAVGELAVFIRSLKDCDQNSVEELFKIMNDQRVREILGWREEANIPLAKAAMMVVALASLCDNDAPVEMQVLKESVDYVVNHIGTVEALLPELFRRRIVTKGEIASIVELASVPMASGLL